MSLTPRNMPLHALPCPLQLKTFQLLELGQKYQHTSRSLNPSSLFSFATFKAAPVSIAQLQAAAKDMQKLGQS